jgi:hypothetical protein
VHSPNTHKANSFNDRHDLVGKAKPQVAKRGTNQGPNAFCILRCLRRNGLQRRDALPIVPVKVSADGISNAKKPRSGPESSGPFSIICFMSATSTGRTTVPIAQAAPVTGHLASELSCEVCGNTYDKAFQVVMQGRTHTFDCFECAIQMLAPLCHHCGCRIIGHGVEEGGRFYCCAHCAHHEGAEQIVDRA